MKVSLQASVTSPLRWGGVNTWRFFPRGGGHGWPAYLFLHSFSSPLAAEPKQS